MPIYEEKLISPLALHFTQDHIRTTFRDHRSVEAAIALIEAEPSTGEYDLILKAPFPNIEILRWRPKRSRRADSDDSESGEASDDSDCDDRESRDEHWFTLDNRRLYCLQRKAAEYWPARVAAVAEVLYNDADSVRKKYDSKSSGWAVTIAHSVKGPQLAVWDWRKSVMAVGTPKGTCAGVRSVQVDNDKETVEELTDAPQQGGGGLMAMLAAEAQLRAKQMATGEPRSGSSSSVASPKEQKAHARCDTPSTAHTDIGSDSSDESQAEVHSDAQGAPSHAAIPTIASVKKALAGVWMGGKGETYEILRALPSGWQCVRTDATGRRTFSLWYEQETGLIWWGNEWSFFMDAQEVTVAPRKLAWYSAGDASRRRPRFTWIPMEEEEACDYDLKAAAAIHEILSLLWASGGMSYQLWVPEWVERYQGSLGSLRHFLESRPDQFAVTPSRGPRQYAVSAVAPAEPEAAKWGNRAPRKESKTSSGKPSGPIGTVRHGQWAPQLRNAPAGAAPPGVW